MYRRGSLGISNTMGCNALTQKITDKGVDTIKYKTLDPAPTAAGSAGSRNWFLIVTRYLEQVDDMLCWVRSHSFMNNHAAEMYRPLVV